MTILKSLLYYVITGMAAFFIGRFLPKQWVDAHKPLYRSHPYEQDGRIYERLHIRRWQNKVPDMSRLLPGRMPPKALPEHPTPELLHQMIQETCVAELIHAVLCLTGFGTLLLWPSWSVLALWLVYVLLGNLPFILIQRYNRPRLQRLLQRLNTKERTSDPCAF